MAQCARRSIAARLSAAAPLETLSPELLHKILVLVASHHVLGPSRESMLRILSLSRKLYPTIQAVADMCVEHTRRRADRSRFVKLDSAYAASDFALFALSRPERARRCVRLELEVRDPRSSEGFVATSCGVVANMGHLRALSLKRGVTCSPEDIRRLRRALVIGGAGKSLRWLFVECEWGEEHAEDAEDAFAELLASVPDLHGLEVNRWWRVQTGDRHIFGLGSLRTLKLYTSALTARRVAALSASRQLTALWLEEVDYDDAALRQLVAANGQSLRSITLWGTSARNADDDEPLADAVLRTAPKLRALALHSTQMGALSLIGAPASAHTALEVLYIWHDYASESVVGLSAAIASRALRRLRRVTINLESDNEYETDLSMRLGDQLAVSDPLFTAALTGPDARRSSRDSLRLPRLRTLTRQARVRHLRLLQSRAREGVEPALANRHWCANASAVHGSDVTDLRACNACAAAKLLTRRAAMHSYLMLHDAVSMPPPTSAWSARHRTIDGRITVDVM